MPSHPALAIAERLSPNHGARAVVPGGVSMVVIHYTGMRDAAAALDRLTDAASEVSAHYLIDEGGAVTHLVPEDRRAWHAGKAFWRGIRDVNSASIGIELVNPGHEFGYRDFPSAQIEALTLLLGDITVRHRIAPCNIVGHSDVAPGRKIDPGERFPWRTLAARGLAIWPSLAAPGVTMPEDAALKLLAAIGYASPLSADSCADLLTPGRGVEDVVSAFQRRFRPARVDGVLDPETAGLIAAVASLTTHTA